MVLPGTIRPIDGGQVPEFSWRIFAFTPIAYTKRMTALFADAAHRKAIASAIARVLTRPELTMVHQCWAAEHPGKPAPAPEDILLWVRLNMPLAAARLDDALYPAD